MLLNVHTVRTHAYLIQFNALSSDRETHQVEQQGCAFAVGASQWMVLVDGAVVVAVGECYRGINTAQLRSPFYCIYCIRGSLRCNTVGCSVHMDYAPLPVRTRCWPAVPAVPVCVWLLSLGDFRRTLRPSTVEYSSTQY